jgi:hypothetical protein
VEARVGFWKAVCSLCLDNFNAVDETVLRGFIVLCCDGFDVCGRCLANVDRPTFKKIKNGEFCPSYHSIVKNNASHVVPVGVNILNLKMERCAPCSFNNVKDMYYLESKHSSKVNFMNTALPPDVKEYKSDLRLMLEGLITTHGRQKAIVGYNKSFCRIEIIRVINIHGDLIEKDCEILEPLPRDECDSCK